MLRQDREGMIREQNREQAGVCLHCEVAKNMMLGLLGKLP